MPHTRQREIILHVLKCSQTHPTADQVHDEARKTMPHISRGTVYRNLKVLTQKGAISALDISGTSVRYEGRTERHYHFRCERCGRVLDVDEPIDHDLNRRIAEKTGFTVVSHQLEFRGLCGNCEWERTIDHGNHNSSEEESTE